MGIQSKRKHSSDETLHTLNEQLQAPCVNYRCYYSCLWQCCAQLPHFELKEMPWQNHVLSTGTATPLKLVARNSAWTFASVAIAIKESTTPGTLMVIHLYTELHVRKVMLYWQNYCLPTLPMWTALTIWVGQLFIGLHIGAVLTWQNT